MTVEQERRAARLEDVEIREVTDGLNFSGRAVVYDTETDLGYIREKFAQGALTKTLKEKADVRLLVNHDGIPLARTKSGTLTLEQDAGGLRVDAHLDSENPRVQELRSAMSRGDIDQMSFAFRPVKESMEEEDTDKPLRIIREAELFDVSVVTFPAYETTTAEMRSATKLDLLALYAASLGLSVSDWPNKDERAAEDEPHEHSTDALDIARLRVEARKRRMALSA